MLKFSLCTAKYYLVWKTLKNSTIFIILVIFAFCNVPNNCFMQGSVPKILKYWETLCIILYGSVSQPFELEVPAVDNFCKWLSQSRKFIMSLS